jgi:heme-degrading monooxygenase HmoA
MIVAITEFRLKRFSLYFKALKLATKSREEAQQANGFIYLKTGGKGFMTLRTLSAWKTLDDMKAYVKMPAHLEAMKESANIASHTYTMHIELDELPSWKKAFKMLKEQKK